MLTTKTIKQTNNKLWWWWQRCKQKLKYMYIKPLICKIIKMNSHLTNTNTQVSHQFRRSADIEIINIYTTQASNQAHTHIPIIIIMAF